MSTTGSRRGRKPKSPGGRKKANIMLPVAVHDRFTAEALDLEVPLSDVGAFYMVLGWNALHGEDIPMPAYLHSQLADAPRPTNLQAPLLDGQDLREALLAS